MSDRPATPRPFTPLPWVVVGDGLTHVDIYSSSNQQGGPPFCVRSSNSRQDAAYIVHAANSVPKLEAEIERLKSLLEDCKQCCHERCTRHKDSEKEYCDCGAVEINARIDAALNPKGGTDA